jgi:hypothetical protein
MNIVSGIRDCLQRGLAHCFFFFKLCPAKGVGTLIKARARNVRCIYVKPLFDPAIIYGNNVHTSRILRTVGISIVFLIIVR